MNALLVVDVQNDFCPGGALAVPDDDAVIAPINRLARDADFVVATRDWHSREHRSFLAHGGRWPEHCIADTQGAQLRAELHHEQIDVVIDKGRDPATEGYSGFEATGLGRAMAGEPSCALSRRARPARRRRPRSRARDGSGTSRRSPSGAAPAPR